MNKDEARRAGQAARAALDATERRDAAARLAAALPGHPLLAGLEPAAVLVPSHYRDEISTERLARRLETLGWIVHRPRTVPAHTTIEAIPWPTDRPLTPGYAGIPEPPRNATQSDPTTLRLVLVPGSAFAPDGARVGTGWGYFDRFLAPLVATDRPPLILGIGYQGQLLPHIASEPHDIPMDGLQLEERSIDCRRHPA